ncbi:MAG: zinc dependent phospholipase C family protein [Bacilli bacterium]|nr:zinc dependent phospholipase C family protein [Bacilli bacterium]
MASAIIHLAVAKKLLDYIKVENKKDYLLGSIAPDISKQIGSSKVSSHFLIKTKPDVPNIQMFINKYPNFINNSFDLGYFVHLYTDKLWFDGFLEHFIYNNSIKLLDGTIIETTKEEMQNMIYSDYTNMNIELIDKYEIDLSLFYEEFQIPKTNILEIPTYRLDILINKMGILISNSKQEKAYTLDINQVEQFIDYTCNEIIKKLQELYQPKSQT